MKIPKGHSQEDNLIDSIIALKRQAEKIKACKDTQRIFGVSPRVALQQTQKAALIDIDALVQIIGENTWTIEQRHYFRD